MSSSRVVRRWTARATPSGADAYVDFFREKLRPELARIDGHEGALVSRRPAGDHEEITVLTFWRSLEAVKSFAGESIDRAVVEPEARAVLSSFDDTVTHHTVALDTR